MFFVRQVPVVIEPGVAVLEAEMQITDPAAGARTVAAHIYRVPLSEKVVPSLPIVPTTEHPHVFSLHEDLDKSPLLLVYDLLGRLSLLYIRDKNKRSWDRHVVVDEHAGKTVTQFSVRYCFSAIKDRNRFVELMRLMSSQVQNGTAPTKNGMTEAMQILSRSRAAPVLLPVAVAKSKLKNARV